MSKQSKDTTWEIEDLDAGTTEENAAPVKERPVRSKDGGRGRSGRGRKRRRKKGAAPVLVLLLLTALGLAGFAVYRDYSSRIRMRAVAEVGTQVLATDFLRDPSKGAAYEEPGFLPDTAHPGEQELTIRSGLYRYHVTLVTEDTVAPQAAAKLLTILYGERAEAADFVADIQDMTQVSVSFAGNPDFDRIGTSQVALLLTDEGGNVTEVLSELTVSPVLPELTLEAGDPVPGLSDLLVGDFADAEIISAPSEDDMHHVGTLEILSGVQGEHFLTFLHVTDTKAPSFSVQDLQCFASSGFTPGSFVTEASDATDLSWSYAAEPDLTSEQPQEVEIIGTDEGGNTFSRRAMLTLTIDREAPVMEGVKDMVIREGDTLAYKQGVTVTDNCDTDITFTVDAPDVDPNKEGIYRATYTATDRAGNTTQQTIQITVLHRDISIDEVNALADQVLADILTPDMTEMEKLKKIYSYVYNNIGYENRGKTEDGADWVPAAYEGLVMRTGDCLTYASTSKVLLTRAGIENIDICKIPTSRKHFWNLVNIGEGWYHFDACRRSDHPYLCYVDDATLMAYSAEHHNSHMYVRDDYPEIVGQ